MKYLDNLHRLERLEQLIRMKAAGNAKALAKKMGVSRSTLFNLMEILRAEGKEIIYDRFRKTYKFK